MKFLRIFGPDTQTSTNLDDKNDNEVVSNNMQQTDSVSDKQVDAKSVDQTITASGIQAVSKDDTTNATEEISYESLNDKGQGEVKKIYPIKRPLYKPLVYKKLTIILLESTHEVLKQTDMIIKMIKGRVTSGLICIISYGNLVKQSQIVDATQSDNYIDFIHNQDVGNQACLFDALMNLERLFDSVYLKMNEKEKERSIINNIEIMGIGTCKDTCSIFSKKIAIESFCRVIHNPKKVTTKYFCLTEESFLRAAEIGFHSIGAINRTYKQ